MLPVVVEFGHSWHVHYLGTVTVWCLSSTYYW